VRPRRLPRATEDAAALRARVGERRSAALALSVALLAACAPDAFIPSRPYDAFLDQLAKACRDQAIGTYSVDQLVRRSGSKPGGFFNDQTSRLYHGTLGTQDWIVQVTGFVGGTPQDPGIGCVIREYNETRQWVTPPRGAPSGDAPPGR